MAFVSILALAWIADAEALQVACGPVFVAEMAPAPGAVEVPTDSMLAFGFDGCEGEAPLEVTLYLVGLDGQLETVQTETLVGAPGRVAWVAPEGGLLPDREYRVVATGARDQMDSAFGTGAGPSEPLDGVFAADMRFATFIGRVDETWMEVEPAPVADPEGLSVVELVSAEDPDDQLAAAIVANRPSTFALTAVWESRRKPSEVCAVARQVDGAGRIVGEEEICAEPDRARRGCSTSPAAPAWLALVGLVFSRRSRRG